MSEVWKDVPGWEGLYQASSFGRVRSCDHVLAFPSRWGTTGKRRCKGRILKLQPISTGYLHVTLCEGEKRRESYYVHQLILITFTGPCPQGMETRHFPDPDKTNNHIDNLQWGTSSDNKIDIACMGKKKLTLQQVEEIKTIPRSIRFGCGKIARKYGVTKSAIYSIIKGRTWKWV